MLVSGKMEASSAFDLVAPYQPAGDQPKAIDQLVEGLDVGLRFQTLVGVTGSGKTFTMANVIARLGRPTLVLSHNKVLAAQLYSEFAEFFPHNAVSYFVSYYDYYQPEAYIPQTDTFIEKEVQINDELERLRLAATTMLMERRDVIVVASVSAIYGLGSPQEYRNLYVPVQRGMQTERNLVLRKLIALQYERNDIDFQRGSFRVRGDVVEVFPAYGEVPVRIEFFGDEVDRLAEVDPVRGTLVRDLERATFWPAKHYVTTPDRMNAALESIEHELRERLKEFSAEGKLLEAERLQQRTRFDLAMLRQTGFCAGIENYSRHIDGRLPGERPYCLLDYFPDDFMVFIDESHMMIPQLEAMYAGDRSRKETLVDYGYRLPSALDNRPLRSQEFWEVVSQAVFVSATPGKYEQAHADAVVEQIVRPTGLVDPPIAVKPAQGQVDDLIGCIRATLARDERVLVTTLTKRMAEDLNDYLLGIGIKVRYLHHQVETIDRVDVLDELRHGKIGVVVGVNLLREGLDLPEVSLVAVLDADREGFLRSESALIQTHGRAARNLAGQVIFYADKITGSMARALEIISRRRAIQEQHNLDHHITPQTIVKEKRNMLEELRVRKRAALEASENVLMQGLKDKDRKSQLTELKRLMLAAAKNLDFELAMLYRDKISELEGRGKVAHSK